MSHTHTHTHIRLNQQEFSMLRRIPNPLRFKRSVAAHTQKALAMKQQPSPVDLRRLLHACDSSDLDEIRAQFKNHRFPNTHLSVAKAATDSKLDYTFVKLCVSVPTSLCMMVAYALTDVGSNAEMLSLFSSIVSIGWSIDAFKDSKNACNADKEVLIEQTVQSTTTCKRKVC